MYRKASPRSWRSFRPSAIACKSHGLQAIRSAHLRALSSCHLNYWVSLYCEMRQGGSRNPSERIEPERVGCATFSSSTYTCTNGDCKETTEEFRKCPGLPLQRLHRNVDGSTTWVKHSGGQPYGVGGIGDLQEFMRSVMYAGCFDNTVNLSDNHLTCQARPLVRCWLKG
jgi:hypothetical protein